MQSKMKGLADEIADRLIQELQNRATEESPNEESPNEEGPSQEMANYPVDNEPQEENRPPPAVFQEMSIKAGPVDTGIQARIGALETRMEALAKSITRSSRGGGGTNLSNLKYAKPKYQNVESLLNYIESKDDEGGVKLVIMNFND